MLLLFLRLATWLISVGGVVIGGITYRFMSGVTGLPVLLYLQIKDSDSIASAIHSGGWFYWLQMAIGLGCSALGGHVAAWIARHDELLNGLLSSFLFAAIGLYSILLGKHAGSLLARRFRFWQLLPHLLCSADI